MDFLLRYDENNEIKNGPNSSSDNDDIKWWDFSPTTYFSKIGEFNEDVKLLNNQVTDPTFYDTYCVKNFNETHHLMIPNPQNQFEILQPLVQLGESKSGISNYNQMNSSGLSFNCSSHSAVNQSDFELNSVNNLSENERTTNDENKFFDENRFFEEINQKFVNNEQLIGRFTSNCQKFIHQNKRLKSNITDKVLGDANAGHSSSSSQLNSNYPFNSNYQLNFNFPSNYPSNFNYQTNSNYLPNSDFASASNNLTNNFLSDEYFSNQNVDKNNDNAICKNKSPPANLEMTAKKKASKTSRPKKFACPHCNKMFQSKSSVEMHITTHTGMKPFVCEICNSRFTRKSSLIRHNRTHTGNFPFSCEVCSKKFNDRSSLNVHQRTHAGSRPFKCEECEKKFTQKQSLKRHQKLHEKKRKLPDRMQSEESSFNELPLAKEDEEVKQIENSNQNLITFSSLFADPSLKNLNVNFQQPGRTIYLNLNRN